MSGVQTRFRHTPGPWSCFYKAKYNEWHVSVPSDGGSMKLAIAADGIQTDHPEADARLIAAAPDMLIALKWAEAALAPFSKEPAEKSGMALIRNAIAHADPEYLKQFKAER